MKAVIIIPTVLGFVEEVFPGHQDRLCLFEVVHGRVLAVNVAGHRGGELLELGVHLAEEVVFSVTNSKSTKSVSLYCLLFKIVTD